MKNINVLLLTTLALILSVSFTSCGGDDDNSVSFKNLNMTAGTSTSIENGKGIDWESENEYIATVSNGTVNALRVGSVRITSDKGSFTVTVSPSSSLYEEPYMKWGSSVSTVKSYMKGYTLLGEKNNILLYYGNGAATYIGYTFENSKLDNSVAYIPTSYLDELVDFINERYVYAYKGDDYLGYVSIDKKIAVLITAQNLNSKYYYAVLYCDFTSSSSSNAPARTIAKNDALKSIFSNVFSTQAGIQESKIAESELMQSLISKMK